MMVKRSDSVAEPVRFQPLFLEWMLKPENGDRRPETEQGAAVCNRYSLLQFQSLFCVDSVNKEVPAAGILV
jgi:hypothetical protein